jgi:sugar phosphate isomerase/epimerase
MTALALPLSFGLCLLLPWVIPSGVFGADAPAPPATQPPRLNIADRAACSSLVRCKQSTDDALRVVSAMGFKWVDLACLNWAPHVSVPRLMEDFEKEAGRVEAALKGNGLRVANLTFDGPDVRPFDQYEREFAALAKLAARLKARLINIMAPSAKADRDEMVRRLRKLQAAASQAGVLLTIETHCDQLTERPADALWLCRQVPGLGLTLDPSHYFAGPNQGANFDALYPFVQGTGFRAGGMSWKEIQRPWGKGPIDFAAVARKLESAGYRGFYVAEYIEGFNELDAEHESGRFLDWAKQL